MQEAELVEQLCQLDQEGSGDGTIRCSLVSPDRLLLENVSRVDYVAELIHEADFVAQHINVLVQ